MLESAPELMTNPLIVFVAVAPVMAPERPMVETPEIAPALMLMPLIVPVVLAVMVEATVRAPAEVILLEDEKNSMSPVDPEARVIFPAPLAAMVKASSVPDDVTAKATPAAAALDVIFKPVAEEPVEASTVRAGLVVPLAPTA